MQIVEDLDSDSQIDLPLQPINKPEGKPEESIQALKDILTKEQS